MKFIGEYHYEVASAWKDRLEEEEIFPTVEEVGGFFGASFATMGTLRPKLRLFVEDADYAKAMSLISDLEQEFEKKVAVDGKEADKIMLKIAIGLIAMIAAVVYITHSKGWW